MAPVMPDSAGERKALPIGKALLLFGIMVCIELGGASLYNLFLRKGSLAPLLFTALQRVVMASIIIGMTLAWGYGPGQLGLSVDRTKKGFRHGILWSLGFGLAAGCIGALLFVVGISPFSLFSSGGSWTASRIISYLLVGCLIGPVVEDLVFVGLLYNSVRKRLNLALSVLAVASLFAMAHGFFAFSMIIQFTGGLLFTLSFEFSESLFTPMVIHCLGNMALLALRFL